VGAKLKQSEEAISEKMKERDLSRSIQLTYHEEKVRLEGEIEGSKGFCIKDKLNGRLWRRP